MTEFFDHLSELRKILCVCPCCGEIVRVSDLHLKVKGPGAKTWLDTYQAQQLAMSKKEEAFSDKAEKIRAKAVEKGRLRAKEIVNKAIFPAFRALKFNPFDVKPVMYPIDFIVFNGMTEQDKVKDITLLSKKSKIEHIIKIRKQVQEVVKNGNYTWHVGRIDDTGKILFE